MSPGGEFKGGEDSTVYSSDITPLSLAAQNGDYKMVRMLLARGHEVEKPHAPNFCRFRETIALFLFDMSAGLCPKCKSILREQAPRSHPAELLQRHLQSQLHLSSDGRSDSVRLPPGRRTQPECTHGQGVQGFTNQGDNILISLVEYGDLAAEVRGFTVDLLNQCRNTGEVELLLKLPEGFDLRSHKTSFSQTAAGPGPQAERGKLG
ncbi:short transient receptor potential channel 6, partial [Caerostris extrusa]